MELINNPTGIFEFYKKIFPIEHIEIKKLDINLMSVCIEKRKDIVYVYVFNEDYFEKNLDDANVLYEISFDDFYMKCVYNIDKSNPNSINEYITEFETEEECISYFESMNIKTM